MNPIFRGARNAFRNGMRASSIILILGVSMAVALSMLLANHAVQARLDDLRKNVGTTLLVRPAGSEGFQGGGEPLKVDQADKLKGLEHVQNVSKTKLLIATKDDGQDDGKKKMMIGGPGGRSAGSVTTNLVSSVDAGTLGGRFHAQNQNGETAETPPVPIPVGGIEGSNDTDGSLINLKEGRHLNAGDTTAALAGSDLATKNNLKLGSTFTLKDQTFTVVGIFDAGTKFGNNSVKIPFTKANALAEQPGEVGTIIVQVDSLDNVEAVKKAIQDTLGSDVADVSSADPSAQSAVESLQTVERISFVGFVVSLGAAGAIILMTMLMIVRERRREIGVLKAIGAKTHKIVTQFVAEAVTLALLAATVGFGAAVLMSNTVLDTLVNANTTSQEDPLAPPMGRGLMKGGQDTLDNTKELIGNLQSAIGFDTLLIGLVAAIAIAIIGSAGPAWLISKIRPAEVMRTE